MRRGALYAAVAVYIARTFSQAPYVSLDKPFARFTDCVSFSQALRRRCISFILFTQTRPLVALRQLVPFSQGFVCHCPRHRCSKSPWKNSFRNLLNVFSFFLPANRLPPCLWSARRNERRRCFNRSKGHLNDVNEARNKQLKGHVVTHRDSDHCPRAFFPSLSNSL